MTAGVGSEVRIHGIGNHAPLSALGSPRLRDGTFLDGKSKETVVVRPRETDHSVWLVAWTRTSRSINSFAWYLGLPFTLCNTAGYMRMPGWSGKVTATVAALVGSLLTLGAYLWSVVIVENIWFALFAPETVNLKLFSPSVAHTSLVVVTAFWVVLLLMRAAEVKYKHPEMVVLGRILAGWHAIVILIAAALIWWRHPASDTKTCWGFDEPPCLVSPMTGRPASAGSPSP